MTSRTAHFRAHGNLVNILGTKLIDEMPVAVLELVKNAYDADATEVKIKLERIFDETEALVIVHDNGHGMTLDDIENRWMVAAFSDKEERVRRHERTARGRYPLGRMGIGRFAAARLGRRLIMVTRAAGHPELRVDIDWDSLAKAHDLSAQPIQIITNSAPIFFKDGQTGTRLAIGSPQQRWTRQDLHALRIQLRRFVSPYTKVSDFNLSLRIPDAPEFENIEAFKVETKSHFECRAEVGADGLATIKWFNHLHGPKGIDTVNLFSSLRHEYRDGREKPVCGPFSVQILAWKGTKTDLKKFGIDEPELLDELTGISIFRDGFRVLPYGDPGEDWLDLNLRRVQNPTERFSSNRILGAISITTEHNPDLEDQANRLGLIENQAFLDFKEMVIQCIAFLEQKVLKKIPAKSAQKSTQGLGNSTATVSLKQTPTVGAVEARIGNLFEPQSRESPRAAAQASPTIAYEQRSTIETTDSIQPGESRTETISAAPLMEFLFLFDEMLKTYQPYDRIYRRLRDARNLVAQACEEIGGDSGPKTSPN